MKMDRKIYKSTRAYFIYLTVENVAGGDQSMNDKAACPPFPSVQARIFSSIIFVIAGAVSTIN